MFKLFKLEYKLKLSNNKTEEIDIDPLDVCEYFLSKNEVIRMKTHPYTLMVAVDLIKNIYNSGFNEYLEGTDDFQEFIKTKYGYKDYFYPDEERN